MSTIFSRQKVKNKSPQWLEELRGPPGLPGPIGPAGQLKLNFQRI